MQFVVIDFEATCDEPYNPDPQEIIEFPAVVVDLEGESDRKEFHTYVRPIAHPQLTNFCTNLTGIRQHQVDRSPTFPDVLAQFENWWRTIVRNDALMVTCGDWDLGSLLPRQCDQHRLPVPEWANRWANLKHVFSSQSSGRATLTEMAASLGVSLVGRLHSGIDDARNVAQVLRCLLGKGATVGNTAFWRCLECGTENFHRDRACSQCGWSSVTLKPGDWECVRCGFGNFSRRDKCFDCGTRRYPGSPSSATTKQGDWLCHQCGEHNFARRSSCYKCGNSAG